MSKHEKILQTILCGTSDSNVNFSDLCAILYTFGFNSRIKGDHHIYSKKGIDEIILFWSEEDNAYIAEVPEFPDA